MLRPAKSSRAPVLWTRRRFAQLVGLAVLGAAQAGAALVVAVAASRLLAGSGQGVVLPLSLVAATLALLGLRILQRRYAEAFALDYVAELRSALISHVIRLPADAREMRVGLVMTRVVNDLSAIKLWLASGLVAMVVAAAMLTTIAAGLAFLQPHLAVALVVAVALWCVPVLAALRPLMRRIRQSRRQRGRIAAAAGAILSAAQTLLLHGRHGPSVRAIVRKSQRMNAALVGRATLSGLLRSSGDLVFPAVALIVASGTLSLGGDGLDAEALGVLVMVTGLTAVQLNAVALGLEYRLAHKVALARLAHVLKAPAIALDAADEGAEALAPAPEGRALQVRDVPLRSDGHGASFAVQPGEVVRLRGVSAAEVSDLFLQMAGLKATRRGSIHIDGKALGAVASRDWWRNVTLISDAFPMIRGTVGDNAALGAHSSVTDAERLRVFDGFGLGGALADTRLGERSKPLPRKTSGAIRAARAVLRRASIVLVDDPSLFENRGLLEALLGELRARGATVVLSPLACGRIVGTHRVIDLSTSLEQAA